MSPSTHCSHCSTRPSSERPAFTWSLAVQGERRSWTCAPCSRTQLDVIERGLRPAH